ncbi:MAG: glycosyltransferase [Proteobacteria bacterium]|jgi:ceramide glucosyltransferase|nr:glycosyltransferase [Pseudomonadota bacterium]
MTALSLLTLVLLIPVVSGSIFSVLTVLATWRFYSRRVTDPALPLPPLTVLKPIYGLDRELEPGLRSFCEQDYPELQIVMSLQRRDDPALPLLRQLEAEYPERVTVVIGESPPSVNGKVQNMVIGMGAARHAHLVVSDSDVFAPRDYLRRMVAPLADPRIGFVCSLYRIRGARNLAERLDLLSINADFMPSVIFTYMTRAAIFCLGASIAFRRSDLEAVGGMAAFADYLVEDHELGRRLHERGLDVRLLPLTIDLTPDYADLGAWWRHQVYWDQNTRAANLPGFALTILTRAVPFALLFALLSGLSGAGLLVLGSSVAVRVASAALVACIQQDDETLVTLPWLPLRDVLALASWALALTRNTFEWRGNTFKLTRGGRIVPRDETA